MKSSAIRLPYLKYIVIPKCKYVYLTWYRLALIYSYAKYYEFMKMHGVHRHSHA